MRRVITSVLLFLSPVILLLGCAPPQNLESQVLDIIRENPQVIIESVQKFQREQASLQIQERFQQVVGEPANIIRQSPTKGSTDPQIVLTEFSNFQCPFCAQVRTTVTEFMTKHKDRVTLTFKHFPLQQIHPQSLPAARASWAALQQQKFWEYHDQLFAQQNRLGEPLYIEIAQNLNLDLDRFNTDRGSRASEEAVLADLELGRQLGVEGTPAFFINDRFFSGAVSLAEMEAQLAKVKS